MNSQIPVLAVVGPTASGKTSLAVTLAERYGGEVVSADSMQLYRGMEIATAAPTPEEMRGIPHHMVGILPLTAEYSVVQYVKDAGQIIADIHARGRLPILCGGTGLYVDSLLDNIRFMDMTRDEALRAELTARAENDPQAAWDELNAVDPETAAAVHPRNITRVVRALEVYHLTGETLTAQKQHSRTQPSLYRVCRLGLNYADRNVLYDRIRRRVDLMLAQGVVEECRALLDVPLSDTAAQAIGYKEFAPYLTGLLPLEDCVEALKIATCHYAKRQLTWFRRDKRTHWLYPDRNNLPEILEISEKCIAFDELL